MNQWPLLIVCSSEPFSNKKVENVLVLSMNVFLSLQPQVHNGHEQCNNFVAAASVAIALSKV